MPATVDAGGTGEIALAQVKIPGGILGSNGVLRVTTIWSYTNNGNNKTFRIRLGGMGGTTFLSITNTTTASMHDVREIFLRNATGSQVSPAGAGAVAGANGNAVSNGSIDTTSDQILVITGQKGTGTDTITLEAWMVEILSDGT